MWQRSQTEEVEAGAPADSYLGLRVGTENSAPEFRAPKTRFWG